MIKFDDSVQKSVWQHEVWQILSKISVNIGLDRLGFVNLCHSKLSSFTVVYEFYYPYFYVCYNVSLWLSFCLSLLGKKLTRQEGQKQFFNFVWSNDDTYYITWYVV